MTWRTNSPSVCQKTPRVDMSLVSELPGIVDEVAIAQANADGVLLTEEEAGMQVQVLASVPITAIRLGQEGVGHVPRVRAGTGLNLICDYLLIVELDGYTHAVLVELKKTWERRAREQVRRSLPLLEYLRSACEVERGAPFDDAGIRVGYLVICENKRLNKQTMRAEPVEAIHSEAYKDVTVRTYIGKTISAAILIGAPPN